MVGDLHVVVPLSPFLTVDSIFGVVVPDSGRCWRICALFSGLMARFVLKLYSYSYTLLCI